MKIPLVRLCDFTFYIEFRSSPFSTYLGLR